MKIIKSPSRSEWDSLTARNIPADDPQVTAAVEQIVAGVRNSGDDALRDYASRFDGAELSSLEVSDEEMAEGISRVSPEVARPSRPRPAISRHFTAPSSPTPSRSRPHPACGVCNVRCLCNV